MADLIQERQRVRAIEVLADAVEIARRTDQKAVALKLPVEEAGQLLRAALRCEECGESISLGEFRRLRADTDFIPHGVRGHLIRLMAVT